MWFIDIKYPKKITLCDTNTVILLTIEVIIGKKTKWDFKKIPCRGFIIF